METELPLNFLNLPVELRLDILEQIDFKDLNRVRKSLPEDRNLIEQVFRKMFKNHEFHMNYDGIFGNIRIYYDKMTIANIDVKKKDENFEEISNFLQYFGHCIKKLNIFYYSHNKGKFLKSFQKQIRKYVARSVNEIEFNLENASINRTLTGLIVPFPNAIDVKLSKMAIDAATLHQMFPAVHSLDLKFIKMEENLAHFRHLERLTIPNGWGTSQSYLPSFEKTLQSNPQLKHLSIPYCKHWELIQTLNEIRPDIESLTFSELSFSGREINETEPLRFANVKVLKCNLLSRWRRQNEHQIPLEFGNLVEIEFNLKAYTDKWIDIMMQNKKLGKVTVHNELKRHNLKIIANGLPNLQQFTMIYDDDDDRTVQDIVDFLQSAKQLKKARFFRMGSNECNAAIQQLSNEWENTANEWDFCCFVRK